MKLWEKGVNTAKAVEQFTVGKDRELDHRLAKYDIHGSLAHAQMLHNIGILSGEEMANIEAVLKDLLKQVDSEQLEIEEDFEDIHSKVEYELTKRLGETGKKIHTARSRNDQVMTDIHLYLKDEVVGIKQRIRELFDRLLQLSNQYSHVIMPGYTHLQIAMPSSFGLWFAAYAEALIDDVLMLNAVYHVVDQNPLGSAAGYGSSFPISRQMTTGMLGFKDLKYNSMASQLCRGKSEMLMAMGMASAANTLNKFAMDVCLFMSQNFAFITFPDELTTGSSIMPHKKNPDVFELVRARCNHLQSLPNQIMLITSNLTSGYHRDFQLLKEVLMPALDSLKECLEITAYMLVHIKVNTEAASDEKYDYMYSVEAVNAFVQKGMSFREAYRKVADQIANGTYKPPKKLKHSHEGSIGNLCNEAIRQKFERYYDCKSL